jgi:hypothetical protein
MTIAAGKVIDLIFGRWRSQVLAAGTELGIFDRLDRTIPRTARELAADMGLDAALLYRLLRAQAAIGLLVEDSSGGFALTESGDLLRAAHPCSLAAMARLEEGPQHYALWKPALTSFITLSAREGADGQAVWSARCYGVARQREGSRQNSIGGPRVNLFYHP